MSITCREAEELLGAYALDALPDDEARRMAEHLATCQEHATATAELRQTQSLLALAVDDAKASADLRARIMSAVEAGPGAGRAETRPPARPVPSTRRP